MIAGVPLSTGVIGTETVATINKIDNLTWFADVFYQLDFALLGACVTH